MSGDRGLEYEIPMEGVDRRETRKREDVKYGPYVNEEAEGRDLAQGEQGPDRELERPSKADIQNKANKTCRGCQVTFDCRKPLIEHCQSIHGMRFKTRRGQSIPPPPVPEAQDGGPELATYAQHSD